MQAKSRSTNVDVTHVRAPLVQAARGDVATGVDEVHVRLTSVT